MSRRGFGSVRKLQSGRFQASYPSADGSRVNAPITFDNGKEAEDWLASVRADKVRGVLGKPKGYNESLKLYCAEWLEQRELRESSLFHYQNILRLHILPTLGRLSLMEIDPPTVRKWHNGLSKTTGKAMQANAYRLLHAILNTAVEDELIPRNPCRIKGARNTKTAERIVMSPDEIARVVGKMPKRYQVMVLVAAYCALRHGETIGLRRKDVNLDAGTITIVETITRVNGRWIIGEPKTDASKRTLHLPSTVLGLLKAYMDEYTGPFPNSRVFTTSRGNPVYASDIRRFLKEAGSVIGRDDLFPHLLRHCGLTMIAQVGATGAEILARGGHVSSNVAAVYQHATTDRDRELAQRLDKLIA